MMFEQLVYYQSVGITIETDVQNLDLRKQLFQEVGLDCQVQQKFFVCELRDRRARATVRQSSVGKQKVKQCEGVLGLVLELNFVLVLVAQASKGHSVSCFVDFRFGPVSSLSVFLNFWRLGEILEKLLTVTPPEFVAFVSFCSF